MDSHAVPFLLERRIAVKKEEEKTLLQEGLKVYKIPPEYVFASRVYP